MHEQAFNLNLPRHALPDRVSIVSLIEPGERLTLASLDGSGCIRHISCVLRHPAKLSLANRKVVIRIYFDDSQTPQVEAPVGDFFGVMHGQPYYELNTPLLSAKAFNGYNCYFPMPFAKSARIEFDAGVDQNQIYLQVDWHRYPDQSFDEPKHFCARWRRENPTTRYHHEYRLLDADGPGQLVGFVYGVRLFDNTDRWSHGGGDNLYIDGQGDHPAYIRGVGGEDVFGVGFGGNLHPVDSHLYAGMPFYTHEDISEARPAPRLVGYRFFMEDAIPFRESLHVRFGCMSNEICSTAYWYQQSEVRPFFRMPVWENLIPGSALAKAEHDLPLRDSGTWQLCGPFDLREGRTMQETLEAEKTFEADAIYDGQHAPDSHYLSEQSAALGRDKAAWRKYDALRGFVDFNHEFRAPRRGAALSHPAAAVARCIIDAPRAMTASFRIAWDDELVLHVNGQRHDLGQHNAFRIRTIELPLKHGRNDVTVKLSNTFNSNHGGWVFSLRVTTPEGEMLLLGDPAKADA